MPAPARILFARHNLRCTEQRLALYEALSASRSHPTAEELYQFVNRSGDARVSLATVYNTLDVLVEAGLCRKLATTNGCSRYDADMSEHLHVRFRETGEMIDVPEELGDRLVDRLPHDVLRQIEVALGIRIDGLSIQILAEPAEAGAKSARRDEVA